MVANPNARCFEDESSHELLNTVHVVLLVLCAIMGTVMIIAMAVGVFRAIKAEFRRPSGGTSNSTRRSDESGDPGSMPWTPADWTNSYDSGSSSSASGDGGGGGGD